MYFGFSGPYTAFHAFNAVLQCFVCRRKHQELLPFGERTPWGLYTTSTFLHIHTSGVLCAARVHFSYTMYNIAWRS